MVATDFIAGTQANIFDKRLLPIYDDRNYPVKEKLYLLIADKEERVGIVCHRSVCRTRIVYETGL